MKLYGIAGRWELSRTPLLSAAKKIARDQLSKETVNNYRVLLVLRAVAAPHLSLQFGEKNELTVGGRFLIWPDEC